MIGASDVDGNRRVAVGELATRDDSAPRWTPSCAGGSNRSAAPGALAGLGVAFNVNTDGYGPGVSPGPTDLAVDPRLAASAAALGVTGSAVAGRTGDEDLVDLGYHYGADPG